jgi:hypothetical protein
MTACLVEPTFKGFKIGRHEDKMGQRSSPSVEILLNDCEVPVANRLGDEGQGLKIALSALDGGRIGMAFDEARAGDLVLLAGKGHESYQILADKTLDWDDRRVAQQELRKRGFDAPA